MGLWDGLKNAEVFERGNYFSPGTYRVAVKKCITKDTRKSGLAFIVEFEVIESNNPVHPVGSKATWVQLMKNKTIAFSSIKEFVCAALGYDARKDATTIQQKVEPKLEVLMDKATGTENALEGNELSLETFMTKTQMGKDFTVHVWSPAK